MRERTRASRMGEPIAEYDSRRLAELVVRVSTAQKYIEAYEAITGQLFLAEPGPVGERLKRTLTDY